MVSNAAQLILDECVERGSNLHDLADYAAIQINDTHPSLVIPELVRLLTEKGIEEKEAYQIVTGDMAQALLKGCRAAPYADHQEDE